MSESRLINAPSGAMLRGLCRLHRKSLKEIACASVERFAGSMWHQLKIRLDDSIALSSLDRNQLGDWSNVKTLVVASGPVCDRAATNV